MSVSVTRFGNEPMSAAYVDLRRYMTVLRQNRRMTVLITLVVFVLAAVYSYTRPNKYTATAEINVLPTGVNLLEAQSAGLAKQVSMPNEVAAVKSIDVAQRAKENLLGFAGTPQQLLSHVKADFVEDSQILQISFTDAKPSNAYNGAKAFANAYWSFKQEAAEAKKKEETTRLGKDMAHWSTEMHSLGSSAEDLARKAVLQALIDADASSLAQLGGLNTNPGTIYPPPGNPSRPSSPNHQLDLVLGLFLGMGLGVTAAFFRSQTDPRLRDRNQLEDAVGSPVLASIPQDTKWMDRGTPRLVTVLEPRSPVAESYRALRTTVLAAAAKHDVRTIMVTSALAGEGKTTTAANLAVVMAQADRRVALVGADLRRPRLHQFFGLANERGLSDALLGILPAEDLLKRTAIPNLWVLSGGGEPEHPAELLQSKAMADLLEEQRQAMDFVIIDCPPILAVADGLGLVPHVDGVLFVADTSISRLDAVEAASVQLTQMGAPVLGAVLNDFDVTATAYYYGYNYSQDHGHRSSDFGGNGAKEGKIRRRDRLTS